MKLTLTLLTLLLTLLLTTTQSFACSCQEWGDPAEMLKNSEGAYLAIPTTDSKITGIGEGPFQENLNVTTLHVLKDFKKKGAKTVTIESYEDTGANCGLSFKKDDQIWLIFTDKNGKNMTANSCTLSSLTGEEDLRFLRALNRL